MINGNLLSQIEATAKGIHLFWIGPFPWVYSLKGWKIQRRKYVKPKETRCETISRAQIALLATEQRMRLPFGWVSFRQGQWGDFVPGFGDTKNIAAGVFRLDLDYPATFVQVTVESKLAFGFALFQGKVVATAPQSSSGLLKATFKSAAIDAVVCYALLPNSIRYCIAEQPKDDEKDWGAETLMVKNLQLPIREVDPNLHDYADEYAEAKARLLDEEDLDPEEFKELLEILRPTVINQGYPRHIDKVLLLRDDKNAKFEELNAPAPLLSLIAHPKWRRVLGFGWFDNDPSLVEGQEYEYRISGVFPKQDLLFKTYGFHTISSGTALPTCFFLKDLMLRFPQPIKVSLAPGPLPEGKSGLSRRGIELQAPNQFYWQFPAIEDWSLVIDFPTPLLHVCLELQAGHQLEYDAIDADGNAINTQDLQGGEVINLDFSTPVIQLRLKGNGFLFTIRTHEKLEGNLEYAIVLPPVLYKNTPPPALPTFFAVENLQKMAAVNDQGAEISTKSSRSELGFALEWAPVLKSGVNYWPPNAPATPPIESSIYQIEHHQLPSGGWEPILKEENWLMGHRRSQESKSAIYYGSDLMQLFPETASPEGSSTQNMTWSDIFDFPLNGEVVDRPLPALGTTHQYRIRSVDIIGRSSTDWLNSGIIDLQKWIPPPVPVGPEIASTDASTINNPLGVHARVLVKDAPDLTESERALLGVDHNLILLKWGWHKAQRELDPYAIEFRIYVSDKKLDAIPGQLLSVITLGGGKFEAQFQLETEISENALRNSFFTIGGYPFFVHSHNGGTTVTMRLERRIPDQNGQLSPPGIGPVEIPSIPQKFMMKPPFWASRIDTVPITTDSTYLYIIRNHLNLGPDHPFDETWIGISACDDQPYVADQLQPLENRPGNESPIVPLKIQARYWTRPTFELPPPLEDIPVLRTREPENYPILFELDVRQFFPTAALTGITHFRLEKCQADKIFASYGVTADNRIIAKAQKTGQSDVEITVANPNDRANIFQALQQHDARKLDDRYVAFLAGKHPHRASLFQPVTANAVPLGPVKDTLQPQSGRYVFRIRSANQAGLISEGDAIVKAIVRIPSMKAGPKPERIRRTSTDTPGLIRFRVPPNEETSHILCFYAPVDSTQQGAVANASVLRIANRPDLFPNNIVRLRLDNGDFAQQMMISLQDPSVQTESNGDKIVAFTIPGTTGSSWHIWACSLTSDGIASPANGPWRMVFSSEPQPV